MEFESPDWLYRRKQPQDQLPRDSECLRLPPLKLRRKARDMMMITVAAAAAAMIATQSERVEEEPGRG